MTRRPCTPGRSRRRPQRQRVLRALQKHGRITQLDFDAPAIDGGPPIRRVASRIAELRDAGYLIDSHERRHAMAVYRLRDEPDA